MPNSIYSMVSAALSQVVSERAADTILRDSLREVHLTAETVTVQEMQRVLNGPLHKRLTSVLPQQRAQLELSALARQLTEYSVNSIEPSYTTSFDKYVTLDKEPGEKQAAVQTRSYPQEVLQEDLNFDDFEFDDPQEVSRVTGLSRFYQLSLESGQEELLSDLARLPGVQGVVLCNASGALIRSRIPGSANNLAHVIARTSILLSDRSWRILSADFGAQQICIRPLGLYLLAIVANNTANLGRLISELIAIEEAA